MDSIIKQEILEIEEIQSKNHQSDSPKPLSVSDADSSSDSNFGYGDYYPAKRPRVCDDEQEKEEEEEEEEGLFKKQKLNDLGCILPYGFLDPTQPCESLPLLMPKPISQVMPVIAAPVVAMTVRSGRQFWKAGDYEEDRVRDSKLFISAGMDHVRIHPKFLHSNATSHKWALGAFAELLDNSLDEACNGATYVNVDVVENKKDGNRMLLIEDNGGGMDPDRLRQCMSLGYSMKSKLANTIGQYGNGFKTSTMRLGADVIVFTRCHGKSSTQSIGMLSYTFLRSTGKEDIVVPMLHYEKEGITWDKFMPLSPVDWKRNLETTLQWSPYSSEADLLLQFNSMKDQGTRIIIYNLWEDDQGELELDFGVDQHDIQIRGVNRDETKIEKAQQFPNSRHFLTYRHSLRSYASILYLRLPHAFRIILRGKDVEHHNLVDDMMLKQEITYRPQSVDAVLKDANMIAVVTIGFVKDAKYHIDIQGFNVYHKNRLIKPFWRVWNAAGSGGRGIIGVLEANFVEPAHDKQGFERTIVLSRLETKLNQMQKTYWNTNRHRIGYSSQNIKRLESSDKVNSSVVPHQPSSLEYGPVSNGLENRMRTPKFGNKSTTSPSRFCERSELTTDANNHEDLSKKLVNECVDHKQSSAQEAFRKDRSHTRSRMPQTSSSPYLDSSENEQHQAADHISAFNDTCNRQRPPGLSKYNEYSIKRLEEENQELSIRLKKLEESMLPQLKFERDKKILLEAQLQELLGNLEQVNKEQDALIDLFSEERCQRDKEEENLTMKLKDSSTTIQALLEKVTRNSNKVVEH